MTNTHLTPAETAKLIRARLKKLFPGTKFSVRTDSYTGGGAIRVTWMDGPAQTLVESAVKEYEGSAIIFTSRNISFPFAERIMNRLAREGLPSDTLKIEKSEESAHIVRALGGDFETGSLWQKRADVERRKLMVAGA